jgi:hypothetical protein
MLTENAIFDRKWQSLPELARLLGDRRLSAAAMPFTSTSRTGVDRLTDLWSVFALTQNNKDELRKAVIEGNRQLGDELMLLAKTIEDAASELEDAAQQTKQICGALEEFRGAHI